MAVAVSQDELLLELLMRTEGEAEIVRGQVVEEPPIGDEPGYAGDAVTASLWAYVEQMRHGRAIGDNKGFLCNLPHRRSFSPDAA